MTDSAIPPPQAGPSSPEAAPSATEVPPRLLCVDDEPGILSALRRLFRPEGWTVLTAESAAAGLQWLEREPVDLVISDMRMPEMDGAQFLEIVRHRWPDTARILLTGYADLASTVAAINQGEVYRYISKPWDDRDMVLTVRGALEHKRLEDENRRLTELTRQQNEALRALNSDLERKVAERTAELQQTVSFLELAHADLKTGFLNTVRIFSELIELRGGRLAGHSRRVAEYARAVAERLHLKESDTQNVVLAALLHDIGKIGLPDAILEKPFSLLAAEERARVMRHPGIGKQILMGISQLKDVATLVLHHHEYFDGSGYPGRLVGLAIPQGARILAAANDYDALVSGTLVGRALRPVEAIEYLSENRGKRYDPAVVDALVDHLSRSLKAEIIEVPLRPTQLRAGMALSRDLFHPDGYLLLARGHVLEPAVIDQLARIETTEGHMLTVHVRKEVK